MVDLPRGAEVFPDIDNFNDIGLNLSPLSDKSASPVVINDYSELSREMKAVRTELKRMSRQQHRNAYNAQYEIYKNYRL